MLCGGVPQYAAGKGVNPFASVLPSPAAAVYPAYANRPPCTYTEHFLPPPTPFLCRIFQVGTRVFADGQVGGFEETGMSYPDFIFFMLSEEDKSSQVALRYWYVKTTDVCTWCMTC
jgi:hypothetical protein